MADQAQYLTLGIDRERFGIEISHVREILEAGAISRLPHAPAYLLGIIDVRGASFPVVDLRIKLGLPAGPMTEATRIILLDVPQPASRSGARTVGVGFVADRVFEVTELEDATLETPPEIGGGWDRRCIAGIGRKGAGFVIVLDIAWLMAADAAEALGLHAIDAVTPCAPDVAQAA